MSKTILLADDSTTTPETLDIAPTVKLRQTFDKFSRFVEEASPWLSLSGMFVASRNLQPVGSVLAFELLLADGFQLAEGVGEVVWVRQLSLGSDEPEGMGIRFRSLSEQSRELFLKVVEDRLAAGLAPFDVERIPHRAEAAPYQQRFQNFSSFVEYYTPWISLSGMFLPSHHLRPLGSMVAFQITLEDGFRLLDGSGEVIWTQHQQADDKVPSGMGLRFTELSENSRSLISKMLEEHVRQGGEIFELKPPPLPSPEDSENSSTLKYSDAALGELEVAQVAGAGESLPAPPLSSDLFSSEEPSPETSPTLLDLQNRLQDLEQEVTELRSQLDQTSHWPARFRDLQQRVEAVMAVPPFTPPPAWQNLYAEELRSRLTQRGFFLSQDTADALWSALIRKKVIVLEGVPGTGKSKLAQLLAEVLLKPHSKRGLCFSEVKVHPDLTVEEFIGGRTITQDNCVGPKCGPLLEAILCCHESRDGHWLLMDEFNRGSVDVIFAPLLDALVRDDGTVQHPHMFPDRDTEAAHIPIPQGFRIIGTMNPLDQGIFEVSQALLQRIQVVSIPALRGEDELGLIQTQVLEPWFDGAGDASRAAARSRWGDLALDAARRLQDLAEQIRALTVRPPAAQFAHCELGSRVVKDAVEALLLRLDDSAGDIASDLDPVLDALVRDAYLPQLKSSGTEALQTLVAEVFQASSYPLTAEALEHLVDQRRVF